MVPGTRSLSLCQAVDHFCILLSPYTELTSYFENIVQLRKSLNNFGAIFLLMSWKKYLISLTFGLIILLYSEVRYPWGHLLGIPMLNAHKLMDNAP